MDSVLPGGIYGSVLEVSSLAKLPSPGAGGPSRKSGGAGELWPQVGVHLPALFQETVVNVIFKRSFLWLILVQRIAERSCTGLVSNAV